METDISITARIRYEGTLCGVGLKTGSFACDYGGGGRCHLFNSNRDLGTDNYRPGKSAWVRVSECVKATKHLDKPSEDGTKTIYDRLREE